VIDQVAVGRKAALDVLADSPDRPLLPRPGPSGSSVISRLVNETLRAMASLTNKRITFLPVFTTRDTFSEFFNFGSPTPSVIGNENYISIPHPHAGMLRLTKSL
jgi:hypothetical protein